MGKANKIDMRVEAILGFPNRKAPKLVSEAKESQVLDLPANKLAIEPLKPVKAELRQEQREAFLTLCYKKESLEEKFHKDMERLKKRLADLTKRRGVSLLECPYTKDLHLYVKPFRGLFHNRGAGLEIRQERAIEWAKENGKKDFVITETSETIDVSALRAAKDAGELPEDVALAFGMLMKYVAKREDIYTKNTDESLNLEAYEVARAKGQIPTSLIKTVEVIEPGKPYFELRKLKTKKPRCERCGEDKPSRKNHTEYTCIRCGYSETKR